MKRQLRKWNNCILSLLFATLLMFAVGGCDIGSGWTGCEPDAGNSSGTTTTPGTTTSDDTGRVGDPYDWPSYNPTLNYNFRDEYPTCPCPPRC